MNPVDLMTYLVIMLTILDSIIWIKGLYDGFRSVRITRENREKLDYSSYLVDTMDSCVKPIVSVIIPFRNEPLLTKSLYSVFRQKTRFYREIIIVDDNSDLENVVETIPRSKEIAYIRLHGLPRNWSPKTYSCYTGYRCSVGEVLLFLDADTWFTGDSVLEKLYSYVLEVNGIVSLLPRFVCNTIRCKIVETLLTTFSHSFLGFDKVVDQGKKLSWFYGCCWAIRRDVYEKLGTHSIVKNSVVEDRDFSEIAKSRRIPVKVVYATDLVETQWYPSFSETVNVLARVLKRHCLKKSKAFTSITLLTLGYYLPLTTLAIGLYLNNLLAIVSGVIAYTTLSLTHIIGVKTNGYRLGYIFIAPLFGFILVSGLVKAVFIKNIVWRERVLENIY